MKTLDQIEARIIVNDINTPGDASNTFIISAPGSYYLTGNLVGESGKHGISIQSNDVTLDLNGFALLGDGGAGGATRGIDTSAAAAQLTNVSVRNGSARGWTGGGIWLGSATALAERLRVANCTGANGLTVGNGSLVRDCVASGNGVGFFCPDRSEIAHCIATVNTGSGFVCTNFVTVLDCTASRNGGHGIEVLGNSTLSRCAVSRNDLGGIRESLGGSGISECVATNNPGNGIAVGTGSSVQNCTARGNLGAGIVAVSACHLVGNKCDANQTGIRLFDPDTANATGKPDRRQQLLQQSDRHLGRRVV